MYVYKLIVEFANSVYVWITVDLYVNFVRVNYLFYIIFYK